MDVVATTQWPLPWPTNSQDRHGLIIRRFLALVLGIAAFAKLYTACSAHPHDAVAITESIVEITLAGWLCSNAAAFWASRIALIAFIGFAVITFAKVHHAATSCGCFGPIQIPPTRTLVFDIAVVVTLIVQHGTLPYAPPATRIAIGLIVAASAAGTYIYLIPKQPTVAPVVLNSIDQPADPILVVKSISATNWLADVGIVHAGESLSVIFKLTNPTKHDLEIRGVDIVCGCTSLPEPPTVIRAQGVTSAKLIVRFPSHPGPFQSQANLTTSAPQLPPLTLQVRAMIE